MSASKGGATCQQDLNTFNISNLAYFFISHTGTKLAISVNNIKNRVICNGIVYSLCLLLSSCYIIINIFIDLDSASRLGYFCHESTRNNFLSMVTAAFIAARDEIILIPASFSCKSQNSLLMFKCSAVSKVLPLSFRKSP